MDYVIKYEGLGGIINFSSSPFIYDTHDLFDYDQNYEVTNIANGNGSVVNRIFMVGKTKSISLQVLGPNKKKLLNELEFKLNQDVVAKTTGKLYVNDQYVRCYLVSSVKADWNQFKTMEYITLTIFVESPKWISEKNFDFSIHSEVNVKGGFRFPTKFPFSWRSNKNVSRIMNDHYDDVKANITFFGPVLNPSIQIGANIYSIEGELLEGERYEIEQFSKKVLKITSSGDVINAFHQRNKESSVFASIPPGEHSLIYNEEFSVRVTLLTERNEPLWI